MIRSIAAALTLVASSVVAGGSSTTGPDGTVSDAVSAAWPTAVSSRGVPYVGPLFSGGITKAHSCTASVVHSKRRVLILTAAHCIRGTGTNLVFAPGYHDGHAPYGVWRVVRVFATSSWLRSQGRYDDLAILRVAKQVRGGKLVGVEDVTGAPRLGGSAPDGRAISVVGYNGGVGGSPVRCLTSLYHSSGVFPAFHCHGFEGGTSGSPSLTTRLGVTTIEGVIGGPHNGGCYEHTSYSSPLAAARTLLSAVDDFTATAASLPGSPASGC